MDHEATEEDDFQPEIYEVTDSVEIDDEVLTERQDNNQLLPVPNSSNDDFQCDSCGLAFKGASALKIHMKTHGSSRKHECTDCKKIFKTRLSLTIHMRSHTGERPYVCEVRSIEKAR